jgi:hypothetical protein
MRQLLLCALVGLGALVGQVPPIDAKATWQNPTEPIRPSIHVEMHGTLSTLWSRRGPESFHLDVNGTAYHLQLDSPELRNRAQQLEDHTVVVTGELQGQTVLVATLRGESQGFVRHLTRVKIKGKVAENIDLGTLGSPPARFLWEISVRGRKYQLDFGGNPQFLAMAQTFRGRTLVVTGELQETSLERLVPLTPAKEPKVPEFVPRWPLSTTVLVTGMALEPGDDESFIETAAVEVQGEVDVPKMVVEEGVPEGCSVMVHAGEQSFWLDLSGRPDLAAKVSHLSGKQVHLTGKLECRPVLLPRRTVQVLVVDELTAV